MKNTVSIESDGINVYVNASVKIIPFMKYFISIMAIVLFGLFVFLIAHIPHHEVKEFLFPVLVMGFLLIYFVVRPVLWNLFGIETLIINTKSISYCYDYGVVKTNLKTIKFNRLGTAYEKVRYFDNVEFGKLSFVDYREEDNLPKLIYETTILLPQDKISEIDTHISEVFKRDFFDKMNFIPYSLN